MELEPHPKKVGKTGIIKPKEIRNCDSNDHVSWDQVPGVCGSDEEESCESITLVEEEAVILIFPIQR